MLRARSGVLPFVDRAGLLTGLTEWMGSREPFAGYVAEVLRQPDNVTAMLVDWGVLVAEPPDAPVR